MRQGTTPELIFTSSIDLTDYDVRINLVQPNYKLVIPNERIEKDTITLKVKLTQEETLAFSNTDVLHIQVDVIDKEGKALRSDIITTTIDKALNDEVITYGN